MKTPDFSTGNAAFVASMAGAFSTVPNLRTFHLFTRPGRVIVRRAGGSLLRFTQDQFARCMLACNEPTHVAELVSSDAAYVAGKAGAL